MAIITGASRGIGEAVALRAAAAGHDVVISYREDEDAAETTRRSCVSHGRRAAVVQADVEYEADVLRMFAAADDLGPVDLLVNNAGVVAPRAQLADMTNARIARMLAVNIGGPLLCAREAVRRMSTERGGLGGAIVNVSSAAARLGSPGEYVDYAATKGAIDTFTIGLAREVAAQGIRVNAVRPGLIHTGIHASGGQPDRVERLAGGIPLGRGGTVAEVADAVMWLASTEASYVTGALLDVAGGR